MARFKAGHGTIQNIGGEGLCITLAGSSNLDCRSFIEKDFLHVVLGLLRSDIAGRCWRGEVK